MRGMMNFLEKTGFLRPRDDPAEVLVTPTSPADNVVQQVAPDLPMTPAAPVPMYALAIDLPQIYANANVPAATYPAEKLLRLLEGLRAMDESTRLQAVQAMDAADDNWSIEDPVRDAALKMSALAGHANLLQTSFAQTEQDTHQLIAQIKEREAASMADIRQQISDLEGLLTREAARCAQEVAELQAHMQSKREEVARSVEQLKLTQLGLKTLMPFAPQVASPNPPDDSPGPSGLHIQNTP
jgi:hypothetical protein